MQPYRDSLVFVCFFDMVCLRFLCRVGTLPMISARADRDTEKLAKLCVSVHEAMRKNQNNPMWNIFSGLMFP